MKAFVGSTGRIWRAASEAATVHVQVLKGTCREDVREAVEAEGSSKRRI
jgi:hypothetical protein